MAIAPTRWRTSRMLPISTIVRASLRKFSAVTPTSCTPKRLMPILRYEDATSAAAAKGRGAPIGERRLHLERPRQEDAAIRVDDVHLDIVERRPTTRLRNGRRDPFPLVGEGHRLA